MKDPQNKYYLLLFIKINIIHFGIQMGHKENKLELKKNSQTLKLITNFKIAFIY